MRKAELVAGAMVIALALSGCSTARNKRWGACAVGGGIIGAAIGGATGGIAVNNSDEDATDTQRGAAIGGGIVGGGALGALLGHLICDPEDEPAPPPPPPPPPPAPKKVAELHGAQFDFNKSVLKPEGRRMLDASIPSLKESSGRVLVEGHTDSVGSDHYNQGLSERRAKTVRDYIVSKGVPASRITTRGYGESKPVASNATEAGRAENRRVEVLLQ